MRIAFASKLRGRNVHDARDMDRGEGVNDSNRTLLSDYLERLEGTETPSESLKQKSRSIFLKHAQDKKISKTLRCCHPSLVENGGEMCT